MKIFKRISILFIVYGCFIIAMFTQKNYRLETLLVGYLVLILGLVIKLIINTFTIE